MGLEGEREGKNDSNEPKNLARQRGPIQILTGRMVLYGLGIYVGIGIAAVPFVDIPTNWMQLLRIYGLPFVGAIIVALMFMLFSEEISKRKRFAAGRFVDVDERMRQEMIESGIGSANASRREDRNEVHVPPAANEGDVIHDMGKHNDFLGYFHGLRRVLEHKSASADEKASILLDKGIAYSRAGVLFFVLSILFWQFLAIEDGFKPQHIFGIVSCSVLFVFIEFLSAWFLKQYRHFVDTSTYLIKVKSIFDRYMLGYLLVEEFGGHNRDEAAWKSASSVIDLLKDQIKWPDPPGKAGQEVGFARDAFEAMSEMAKAVRSNQKS